MCERRGQCAHCMLMMQLDNSVTRQTVRIVLVATTHPGNIGAAARAMKTMGLRELVLVSPRGFPCADATARAAGADDILARARVVSDLAEAVHDCVLVLATSARDRHLAWPQYSPREAVKQSLKAAVDGPVAFVFGPENSGLSNQELDLCQALVRIPSVEQYSSLNLAAAVQVLAYELHIATETGAVAASNDHVSVTHAEMERFFAHLEHTLTTIGYFDPQAPKLLRRRLRRMFYRTQPDRSELNILRGILDAAERAAARANSKQRR